MRGKQVDKDLQNVNVNLKVGLLRKEGGGKRIRRVLKTLVILAAGGIGLLMAAGGIFYLLTPNNIESFTKYTNNDRNQPIEMEYWFAGETCTLNLRNTATGEYHQYRIWSKDQQLLYFDKSRGSMWFEGEEYRDRAAVKSQGDKARREGGVTLKEIKMSKSKSRYSRELTSPEIVWIKYHPEDEEFLGFSRHTSTQR